MRIDDTPPPAAPTDSNDSDTDSKKSDDQKDGASLFSRVLAKNKEGRQEGSSTKGMPAGRKEDTASIASLQAPAEFATRLQPEAVVATHTVEIPVQLQRLVHEISVVAGKQQVHIEMNSSVLKGLQVNIEKQNGAVTIQFLTTSPAITTLLSNNLSLLSKGLEDKGIGVSDIRIDSADASRDSSLSDPRQPSSRFGAGSQGRKR